MDNGPSSYAIELSRLRNGSRPSAGHKIHFSLVSEAFPARTTVTDVYIPNFYSYKSQPDPFSQLTASRAVKHLDVVSTWKCISKKQAEEVWFWEDMFAAALEYVISTKLTDIVAELAEWNSTAPSVELGNRICAFINNVGVKTFAIDIYFLITCMMDLHNRHRDEHTWLESTGDLSTQLCEFLRTRECFTDTSLHPTVKVQFSAYTQSDGAHNIVGKVLRSLPYVSLHNFRDVVEEGSECCIKPEAAEPVLEASYVSYLQQPEYHLSSDYIVFEWDDSTRSFRGRVPKATVRDDFWTAATTGNGRSNLGSATLPKSFGRVYSGKFHQTPVSLSTQSTRWFPGGVKFERDLRTQIDISIQPVNSFRAPAPVPWERRMPDIEKSKPMSRTTTVDPDDSFPTLERVNHRTEEDSANLRDDVQFMKSSIAELNLRLRELEHAQKNPMAEEPARRDSHRPDEERNNAASPESRTPTLRGGGFGITSGHGKRRSKPFSYQNTPNHMMRYYAKPPTPDNASSRTPRGRPRYVRLMNMSKSPTTSPLQRSLSGVSSPYVQHIERVSQEEYSHGNIHVRQPSPDSSSDYGESDAPLELHAKRMRARKLAKSTDESTRGAHVDDLRLPSWLSTTVTSRKESSQSESANHYRGRSVGFDGNGDSSMSSDPYEKTNEGPVSALPGSGFWAMQASAHADHGRYLSPPQLPTNAEPSWPRPSSDTLPLSPPWVWPLPSMAGPSAAGPSYTRREDSLVDFSGPESHWNSLPTPPDQEQNLPLRLPKHVKPSALAKALAFHKHQVDWLSSLAADEETKAKREAEEEADRQQADIKEYYETQALIKENEALMAPFSPCKERDGDALSDDVFFDGGASAAAGRGASGHGSGSRESEENGRAGEGIEDAELPVPFCSGRFVNGAYVLRDASWSGLGLNSGEVGVGGDGEGKGEEPEQGSTGMETARNVDEVMGGEGDGERDEDEVVEIVITDDED